MRQGQGPAGQGGLVRGSGRQVRAPLQDSSIAQAPLSAASGAVDPCTQGLLQAGSGAQKSIAASAAFMMTSGVCPARVSCRRGRARRVKRRLHQTLSLLREAGMLSPFVAVAHLEVRVLEHRLDCLGVALGDRLRAEGAGGAGLSRSYRRRCARPLARHAAALPYLGADGAVGVVALHDFLDAGDAVEVAAGRGRTLVAAAKLGPAPVALEVGSHQAELLIPRLALHSREWRREQAGPAAELAPGETTDSPTVASRPCDVHSWLPSAAATLTLMLIERGPPAEGRKGWTQLEPSPAVSW